MPKHLAPGLASCTLCLVLKSVGMRAQAAAWKLNVIASLEYPTKTALLVPSGFRTLNLRHFPKFTAFFGPNHRDLLVSPSVSTLATIAPCFAPRFSLHGAAMLKTSLYDDDGQQHFPRDTTLSPFQDSQAAALHHDDRSSSWL